MRKRTSVAAVLVLHVASTGALLTGENGGTASAGGWEMADAVPRRQLDIDLDGDGNADVYSVADARTSTPKAVQYAAYRSDVINAYGCGLGLYGFQCSKRLCAYGGSWYGDRFMDSDPSDEVYAPWGSSYDKGKHAYQECSGKGTCNRDTGKCQCFDGYHGKGCRHKECPNDCGEHGVCSPAYTVNAGYTSITPELSQFWDAERSFRCVCDYGYDGIDCSDRICPSGLDPVDPHDCEECDALTNEFCGWDQQVIKFPDAMPDEQHFYLEFETEFGGVPFRTHPIQYNSVYPSVLAGDIQLALEALPNSALPTVQTRVLDNDAGYSATILVAFTNENTAGRQNLLGCEAPSTDDASCTSGQQPMIASINPTGVDCEVSYYSESTEVNSAYTCSSRGECDTSNGKCTCHSGFEGQRCETMYTFY